MSSYRVINHKALNAVREFFREERELLETHLVLNDEELLVGIAALLFACPDT
jgi:hypothetical protein